MRTDDRSLVGVAILIVEDEVLVALPLVEALREAGATVLGPAASVKQALAIVHRERVRAAVLDVNLAGEYVWPVAHELAVQDVPFLFVTGYVGDHLMPGDLKGRVRVTKPALPDEVIELIKQLLRVQ